MGHCHGPLDYFLRYLPGKKKSKIFVCRCRVVCTGRRGPDFAWLCFSKRIEPCSTSGDTRRFLVPVRSFVVSESTLKLSSSGFLFGLDSVRGRKKFKYYNRNVYFVALP